MDRLGGDIEYTCTRCGKVARERGWASHRKSCKGQDAKLFSVKVEAPPPAAPATATSFVGAPFVHSAAFFAPPPTVLPPVTAAKPGRAAGGKRKRTLAARIDVTRQ